MSKPVANQLPSSDPGGVRLALIGEAPGADELAMGFPFAGKSGWLLNGWLAAGGVARSQVFTGNVSQCRPAPNNNDFNLLDWNGGEVQEGITALREDLARFKPNIVVALGNAALHLLRHGNVAPVKSKQLGLFQWRSRVSTWRGSLFLAASSFDPLAAAELRSHEVTRYESLSAPSLASGRDESAPAAPPLVGAAPLAGQHERSAVSSPYGGTMCPSFPALLAGQTGDAGSIPAPAFFKSLATFHPAATFRDPSFTFPLVSDLKRAIAEARSPHLELPRRSIEWGLSIDQLEARCDAIRASRAPVGFDIEGGLGGLQCLSFATTPHDAFVIDLMGEALERPRVLRTLASVLEDPLVPKVCWNASYERAVLQATHSIVMRGYQDGMLAWWERFSELPKGLDYVASILTREPYWADGIGWDSKTGAPRVTGPRFWRYNAIDSMVTLEIWNAPLIRAVVEARTPVPFAA